MYIFEPILRKNWEKTEKSDAKRIASQTEPEGLIKILDIPYIDDGERAHLLDIYYPLGTTEKLPVKGFLVASINYRLAGNGIRFDDQIRDIFTALTWLSENLKNYPADLDNVFLMGDSAGGHFSCVTTAVNLNEDMQKDFGVTYCGFDFKAVAAICPAVDLISPNLIMNINVPVLLGEKHRKSKFRKYLDVAQIISKDFPPYYVNTATNDFLKKQCYKLKNLLDIYKIEYKFHDFNEKENDKYLTHVFNVINPFSPAGDQANTEIAEFFKARMTFKK